MARCWNCGEETTRQQCAHCGSLVSLAVREGQVVEHRGSADSVHNVRRSVQEIGRGNVTDRANVIQGLSDESMVWEESPSLALVLGPVFKWAFLLGLLCFGVFKLNPPPDVQAWCLAVYFGLVFLRFLFPFVSLRSTRYYMTSQRLVIEWGVLTRKSVPYELHQLGDAVIVSPLLLRMLGRGNLTIANPLICLKAIRNPNGVRDLLRNSGQWEAQRMDKIRWR